LDGEKIIIFESLAIVEFLAEGERDWKRDLSNGIRVYSFL
jgi:glutathione S-transferase